MYEWKELKNGAVLFRGGEPVKVKIPYTAWEGPLLREIAEVLGIRVNLTPRTSLPRGQNALSHADWREVDGDWNATVDSWHEIAPEIRPGGAL